MAILSDNEQTEFENRSYVNPQLAIDEGDSFIEKLRATQLANNQQVKNQTYNLGTAVPSNLGGLVGGEGYWTSRYQTPQTNSLANDLRAANRKIALTKAMQNDVDAWQHRYNLAKMAYQRRAENGGGTGDKKKDDDDKLTGNPIDDGRVDQEIVTTIQNYYGVPDATVEKVDGGWKYTDPSTGESTFVSEDFMNKLYDENGELTDEGAVILDTREMLGL